MNFLFNDAIDIKTIQKHHRETIGLFRPGPMIWRLSVIQKNGYVN
jgi:hypothetical protein